MLLLESLLIIKYTGNTYVLFGLDLSLVTLNILVIFTTHKSPLKKVIHARLALGHCGNPAACLHVDQVYGIPVPLSVLSPLFL